MRVLALSVVAQLGCGAPAKQPTPSHVRPRVDPCAGVEQWRRVDLRYDEPFAVRGDERIVYHGEIQTMYVEPEQGCTFTLAFELRQADGRRLDVQLDATSRAADKIGEHCVRVLDDDDDRVALEIDARSLVAEP